MRKIIFLLIVLSFVITGCKTLAEENLPDPGTLPDSPFYFLERITEAVGTFFTFGDVKKAERYATLAAERLTEAKVVAEKGKPALTEKTLERYEMQLEKSIARAEKAQAKGENTEKVIEIMTRVGQATSKHLEVLAEVYEKVPEQAKPAIERAMEVSVKGHEKAVEALKAKNALGEVPEEAPLPVTIPEETRERIQMRVRQELEAEKTEPQRFESFEAVEAFCIKVGGSPEQCAEVEAMCKKMGATTPGECSSDFFKPTIRRIPATEEQQEEARIKMEAIEKRRIEAEAEEAEAALRKKARDELFEQGITPE